MEVFCTAIDEFEAETMIIDLMGAGFANNDITVRLPDKPGGIGISVHTDDCQRASLVKSILSHAGGQEIAVESDADAPNPNLPEDMGNGLNEVGGLLTYRRQYP